MTPTHKILQWKTLLRQHREKKKGKPYGLRYHKCIPFTWEVCSLVWRKERRLLGWGSGRAAFSGAARATVFPLAPPQFIPASCASTVFVELSGDWSANWPRLKITFWVWWAGHKHNWGIWQGAQNGAEKLRAVAAALAVNHRQRKCREKAQPALRCSPPSSCAPERAICSALSLLTPPLTQVLLPQLSCCWS